MFSADSPIDTIPDPPVIRHRLAILTQEREMLHALLRLSERRAAARQQARDVAQRKEAAHASH